MQRLSLLRSPFTGVFSLRTPIPFPGSLLCRLSSTTSHSVRSQAAESFPVPLPSHPLPPPPPSHSSPASPIPSSSTLPPLSPLPPYPRDFTSSITDRLAQYARLPQRGVTLQQLLSVTEHPSPLSLLASAQFLYQELPIRLAKRVMELEALPYGLSHTTAVHRVKEWYRESFRELITTTEPRTVTEELHFTSVLERIYERHVGVVPMMAAGVLQMKRRLRASASSMSSIADQCPYLYEFLNRFYSSRMGIRLLISQHVALHHPQPGYIGTVALHACPMRIIRDAVDDASRACQRELSFIPEVSIQGDQEATFAFLPSHLHHVCFELLKNSMRAVAERFADDEDKAPPIVITLSHDASTFAVRLSDQGGGVPTADLEKVWSFLYTTMEHQDGAELTEALMQGGPQMERMAGWGYGLPLSRLYAKFLGGDLQLLSMPNHGIDCYLYLNKLGTTQMFVD